VKAFKSGFKEILTLVVFFGTIGWAVFAVEITANTLSAFLVDPAQAGIAGGILKAASCDIFLGALITINTLAFQYWFRKKGPPEEIK